MESKTPREETKHAAANGADSGSDANLFADGGSGDNGGKKFAAFLPKNGWEFIWGVTKLFGFPALMCIAMGVFIYWQSEQGRMAASQAHVGFQAAMKEQTAAIREGNAEQRKMTEAMIRLDTKLDAHLRREDRR